MTGLILVVVLSLQILVAYKTWKYILEFIGVFSEKSLNSIKIKHFNNLPVNAVQSLSTATLVNNNLAKVIDLENEELNSISGNKQKCTQVRLIFLSQNPVQNQELSKITGSLNAYLIRNTGVPTEFSTLQDITNRNIHVLQNQIEQSLPVPLYLGLAGTLSSAFVGLWSYSQNIDVENINTMGLVTQSLIKEISVAMICSLIGVGVTTFLSYLLYRPARNANERGLNNFYNFLQAELLPYLSVTAASAIRTLQESLSAFNSQFTNNLEKMGQVFKVTSEAMEIQRNTYETISRLDLDKLIKASAALSRVMDKVEILGETLSNTAEWLQESKALVTKVNELLKTVDGVGRTVTSLENGVAHIELLNSSIEKNIGDVAAFAQGSGDTVNNEIANLSSEFIRHIKEKLVPDLQNQFSGFELELAKNSAELLSTMKEINGGFQNQKKELIESLRSEHKNLSKLDNLTKLDRLELLRDVESSLRSIDRTLKNGSPNREKMPSENGQDGTKTQKRRRSWFRKLNFWFRN
jgi:hypothetical protein